MADKPSRGLVLYGDELARSIDPSSYPRISSLLWLLVPPSLPLLQITESEDARIVRDFTRLMDACDAYTNMKGEGTIKCLPTISDRFMGMRDAILTDNPSLKSFGSKLGFSVLQLNELVDSYHPVVGPSSDAVALELLKLLGFQSRRKDFGDKSV